MRLTGRSIQGRTGAAGAVCGLRRARPEDRPAMGVLITPYRHPGESRGPGAVGRRAWGPWIPAFAGMTEEGGMTEEAEGTDEAGGTEVVGLTGVAGMTEGGVRGNGPRQARQPKGRRAAGNRRAAPARTRYAPVPMPDSPACSPRPGLPSPLPGGEGQGEGVRACGAMLRRGGQAPLPEASYPLSRPSGPPSPHGRGDGSLSRAGGVPC